MEKQGISKTVKAGSLTDFFDLKETKDAKSYLVITQSRFMGEGKGRERPSIVLFREYTQEFLDALKSLLNQLI